MILGTAAYMSPEQAGGARISAFGVVLFEMLEGKQTFTGDTPAETLASVLKEQISFERLRPDTPPAVRKLLARCLHRDVRLRLRAGAERRGCSYQPQCLDRTLYNQTIRGDHEPTLLSRSYARCRRSLPRSDPAHR
jgi:serine/threonine protein kinase